MEFYYDISNQLYCLNYKIDNFDYLTFENFIEAKHTEAKQKGKLFYTNLIRSMPRKGQIFADKKKGDIPTMQEKIFWETLEYCQGRLEDIEAPSGVTGKTTKDKLTHKQQILLLHAIGFFELQIFQTLSQTQKGLLVSHLLNRTSKDSENLIRYFKGKTKDKKFESKTEPNIKAVKQLLKEIGREDIEVK